MVNIKGVRNHLKWVILGIAGLTGIVTSCLFSTPVFAATAGSVTGTFTVINPAPEVVAVRLFQADHQTPAVGMSANDFFWMDIEIKDSSLADIKSIRTVLFYNSDSTGKGTPPASDNATTCAVIDWSKGNNWNTLPSVAAGMDNTWSVSEYTTPSDTLSQGKWSFKFQPGKLAQPTGLAGKNDSWDIAVQAEDSGQGLGTGGAAGYSMADLQPARTVQSHVPFSFANIVRFFSNVF